MSSLENLIDEATAMRDLANNQIKIAKQLQNANLLAFAATVCSRLDEALKQYSIELGVKNGVDASNRHFIDAKAFYPNKIQVTDGE